MPIVYHLFIKLFRYQNKWIIQSIILYTNKKKKKNKKCLLETTMIFIQKATRLLEPQNWVYTHKSSTLFHRWETAIVRGVETNEHMNGMQKQHCISGVHFGCFILFFFMPVVLFSLKPVVWCNSARQWDWMQSGFIIHFG